MPVTQRDDARLVARREREGAFFMYSQWYFFFISLFFFLAPLELGLWADASHGSTKLTSAP